MNKQLIIFYLKRHVLGIVGLALAIGFGVFGFLFMGEAKDTIDGTQKKYDDATGLRNNLVKGQELGGSTGIKIESKNVDAANDEAEIHQGFIKDAAKVIQEGTVDPMGSEEFMVHMANVIEEMNQRAREAMVQVQRDPTNTSIRIPYNFTFMNLRAVPQLAKSKIPDLQYQLTDIRAISGILFRSRVRSIESLQRTRVTHEDFMAGASRDFLDMRTKYTNNISVVRPYKVRFQCLSGGIAKALNGFASEKNFFVIRKLEVTQLSAEAPAASGGMGGFPGMGGSPSTGGFPGAGGSPSAGGFPSAGGSLGSEGSAGGLQGAGSGGGVPIAKPKKALTAIQMEYLVKNGMATKKASNVISESILEVELDLDVIRKKPGEESDPDEEEEPVPLPTPQSEPPPASTNAAPGNSLTNAPSVP